MSSQSDQLFALWQQAEQRPFVGFDFAYFADKWVNEQPPWSYEVLVREQMAKGKLSPGYRHRCGEKLAEFQAIFPAKTVATEGYLPNLALAHARLDPLGVEVIDFYDDLETVLPLPDASFDLVINRHSAFNARDLERVLTPGGVFLTQQVDGRNLSDLSAVFGAVQPYTTFTLEFAVGLMRKTNLVLELAQEWTGKLIFKDVATLVYYLKAIPWTVANFSVEKYRVQLEQLQQKLEAEGELIFTERRMLIKAKKSNSFVNAQIRSNLEKV